MQLKFTTTGILNTSFQYVFLDAANNHSAGPATYFISWTTTLPVVLSNFSVVKENDYAVLNWATSSELNVKLFNIERSNDFGKTWVPVGAVLATGNSAARQSYSFTDANPESGTNLYRLQIQDNNGTLSYSSTGQVQIEQTSSMNVFPNPVGQEQALNIQLAGLKAGAYKIILISSSGQTVKQMVFTITNSGSATLVILTGNLPTGSYILSVKGDTQQFSKTVIIANR